MIGINIGRYTLYFVSQYQKSLRSIGTPVFISKAEQY